MYDEKLEGLINAALADGEVTEKEKEILFRKAESMGIDHDEFEMVLNAKITEMKKQQEAQRQASKPAKKENVRKCPACGGIIDSFTAICPYCGAEIRNTEVASSVEKFSEKLAEIEAQRVDGNEAKEKKKIGCLTICLWIFFYWILIPYYVIRILLSAYREPQLDGVDKRKQEFILNAPVPNSKEDLMEFIILCTNRIENIPFIKMFTKKAAMINCWNNIWAKKLNTLEMKVKIAMKNDKHSIDEAEKLINEGREKIKQNQKQSLISIGVAVLAIALFILILFLCS